MFVQMSPKKFFKLYKIIYYYFVQMSVDPILLTCMYVAVFFVLFFLLGKFNFNLAFFLLNYLNKI